MNIDSLKTELTDDPLTRGYTGMTDAEVVADLNTVYRTTNKSSMTGSEVLNAIDKTEYLALGSDAIRDKVWQLLHLGTLNPFGIESDLMIEIFGSGSATIIALAAARVTDVSRAAELGLGTVKVGHVIEARK